MNNRNLYVILHTGVTLIVTLLFFFDYISPNILFIVNCIFIFNLLVLAKMSIISLAGIFIFYPIISARNQFVYGKSYGVLEYSIEKGTVFNYKEILFSVFLSLSVMIIFICLTNVLEKEKNLQRIPELYLSRKTEILMCVIAAVATIIAFPTLPFTYSSGNRFAALLPGNAWNHLAISFLCVLFLNKSKSKFSLSTIGIITFWFLSHYERVDIFGLYLGFVILKYSRDFYKTSIKNKIVFLITLLGIILAMVYIGEKRATSDSITMKYLFTKLLVQNTGTDIIYVFNTSINMVSHTGLYYGRTLIRYITDAIPLINGTSLTTLIRQFYYSPGGEYILAEPYINFGYLGIILSMSMLLFLINKLVKKLSLSRYIYYTFFICTIPRICWYGISYVETASLFFIPLIILMIKKVSKNYFSMELKK